MVYAVSNASIIRSPDQVTNTDPILQRLLDEAEVNLRWDKFYATEECVIQREGIRFVNRTLYRRLEIVVSYLHALRIRRQREKKSTQSVPNPVFVEVTLARLTGTVRSGPSEHPIVIPFSPAFTARKDVLKFLKDNSECFYARFLLKLRIHTGRGSRVSAMVDSDEEAGKKERKKLEEGSDAWLQAETEIVKGDADFLYARKAKLVVSDMSVVMLKPVVKSSSELHD